MSAVVTQERLVRDESRDLLGHGEAVFNEARTHRYLLIRTWEQQAKRLVWVMLNPSTASAEADDPTIRRVTAFTRREDYGALAVVNLFGLRATNPAELRGHPDPAGERNDEFILDQCRPGWTVVAAWGAHGTLLGRAEHVTASLLARGVNLACLGVTKDRQPRHPLYVPAAAPLVPYGPAATQTPDHPRPPERRDHMNNDPETEAAEQGEGEHEHAEHEEHDGEHEDGEQEEAAEAV